MERLIVILSVLLLAATMQAKDNSLETKRITIYPKEKPMHIEVPKEDMDVMVDCAETAPGIGISRKELRHLQNILQHRTFKTDPNLLD
jgi:hypothetical protein